MSIIGVSKQKGTKSKNFQKKEKYKAFTLIEMLIVIVIIGIMMTFTMNYSGQQVFKLRQKSVQETFLDSLNTFQTISLASNYYEQKKYKNIILTLEKDTAINYIFSGGEYGDGQGGKRENQPFGLINEDNIVQIISTEIPNISEDSSNNSSYSPLTLVYSPYQLGCEIKKGEESSKDKDSIVSSIPNLYFRTKSKKNTLACYQIQTATCKFKKIKCSGEL